MSERKSGWYWVRWGFSTSNWWPAYWDGKEWRTVPAHNHGGPLAGRGDVAEAGSRIPHPDDMVPTPPVTPEDIVRVLAAVAHDARVSIYADGGACILTQPGGAIRSLAPAEVTPAFRRALDFLDGKDKRTIIDVLKEAV